MREIDPRSSIKLHENGLLQLSIIKIKAFVRAKTSRGGSRGCLIHVPLFSEKILKADSGVCVLNSVVG